MTEPRFIDCPRRIAGTARAGGSACRSLAFAAGMALCGMSAAHADLASHRALYEIELVSARPGSPVSNVDGQMMTEAVDVCDGWVVEQRYRMHFAYMESPPVAITTSYATWEANDGGAFSFNMRTTTDGVVTEETRGEATLTPAGGAAHYRLPEPQDVALPPGTLLPTAHTRALIEQAQAGRTVATSLLFDGTTATGLSEVSAVIGTAGALSSLDEAVPLTDGPSWQVSLAFFSATGGAETPDYELSAILFENGLIGDMTIDYGDFVIRSTLREVEAIDPGC